jgi:hypothetical protein
MGIDRETQGEVAVMTSRRCFDASDRSAYAVVRRRSTALGALICAVVWLASLGVGQASAATLQLSAIFSGPSAPNQPQALAVDQATGDVYVLDLGLNGFSSTIERFSATGNPVPFSASESYVRLNELTGTPSNSFFLSFLSPDAGIAVDNSGGPFDGDIYVTDGFNAVVDVFAPSGTYLGQLNGLGAPEGSFVPCGVAVDPQGRVYVGDDNGFVEMYTPTSANLPVTEGDYTVSALSGVGGVCAVATDAAGDVFASVYETGPLDEYAHSQFPASGSAVGLASEVDANSRAVAVDPSSGHVFVDEGAQISAFDVSGSTPTLIETFGSLGGSAHGLAVYAPSGSESTLYASNEAAVPAPAVELFRPAVPAPPAVVSESEGKVTSSSADLKARVNPDFADTTYHFEYGPTTSYGTKAPIPDMDIGSEGGLAALSAPNSAAEVHIQGLQPGTVYHYRVVASNASGTTVGHDATFETRAAGGPPSLLDGRAWEMVSPLEKNRSLLTGIDGQPGSSFGGIIQAAESGDAIVYASNGAFAEPSGSTLAAQYLARRGSSEWSTSNIDLPLTAESFPSLGFGGPYKAFSSELSRGVLLNAFYKPLTSPRLSDAPQGYQDLFVRELATGGLQPLMSEGDRLEQSDAEFELAFEAATPDMSHVIFRTTAALTPEAVASSGTEYNLYDWSDGQLKLINIVPGETPGEEIAVPLSSSGESVLPAGLHSVSDDGSRVFFSYERKLYVREDNAHTVQVDESKEGLSSGAGVFQAASTDGSRVFFTDKRQLTADATTANGGADLYEFNLDSGQLSDLTTADPAGAEVQSVIGASDDGAYVYFVANGVLAPGATHGHCERAHTPEKCNLYVWHRGPGGGSTRFIAALSEEDNQELPIEQEEYRGKAGDWAATIANRTSRVTADGLNVVFMSNGRLNEYDNTPVSPNDCGHNILGTEPPQFVSGPCEEVYVYNAAGGGHLSCASCNPDGAQPFGPSNIPGGTQFEGLRATYQSRVLSDDAEGHARVFFNSRDALVPQDDNGQQDVYEWEEDGRGNCSGASGCTGLISSGTSGNESGFADASANGDDAFFLTTTPLVPSDTDDLLDLYDARVGGGFPTGATPPTCNGTGCQGVPSTPPIFATPSSATFSGVGNFGSPNAVKPKLKTAAQIRAEKLTKALKTCRKRDASKKAKRVYCEAQARKRYGAKSKPKKTTAKGRK